MRWEFLELYCELGAGISLKENEMSINQLKKEVLYQQAKINIRDSHLRERCEKVRQLQADIKELKQSCKAHAEYARQRLDLLHKAETENKRLEDAVEQHRWIPVSEKPKENGRYLVCIEDYCKKVNPSVSWREANWINERGWLEINMSAMPWEVTHWKPIILPEQSPER